MKNLFAHFTTKQKIIRKLFKRHGPQKPIEYYSFPHFVTQDIAEDTKKVDLVLVVKFID